MKLGTKKGCNSNMPCHKRGKSACFSLFPKVKSSSYNTGGTPVYLNVYDLTPMNGYVYWAGLGVFHSGVEVHGVEYAFGAHDYPSSGVFEVEPRQCPGFKFRKSIFMGTTCLDPVQVREFMEHHSTNYNGDTYHLIVKNCNHFCKDICYKLTGNPIPKWVNRLARIGSLCNCILPEALKVSAVRPDPNYDEYDDNEKRQLRSAFNCWSSISMRQSSFSMRQKQLSSSSMFLPPLELKRSNDGSLKESSTNSRMGKYTEKKPDGSQLCSEAIFLALSSEMDGSSFFRVPTQLPACLCLWKIDLSMCCIGETFSASLLLIQYDMWLIHGPAICSSSGQFLSESNLKSSQRLKLTA